MALSAIRWKFTFNQQVDDTAQRRSRQRFNREFAATVVEDFTFNYADRTYKALVGKLEKQISADVKRELVWMASLFRRHIVGAGGTRGRPAGSLSTLATGDFDTEDVPIAASLPEWAPRNARYLERKQTLVGHKRWFELGGYLMKKSRADIWQAAFGPIRISFQRSHVSKPGVNRFNLGKDPAHVRVTVGTLKVFALSKITPAMLPALSTGDPTTMNSSSYNYGLLQLVEDVDPQLRYRLGARNRPYRPTLEPFLAFFLTRSVPIAVATRISAGVLGRL